MALKNIHEIYNASIWLDRIFYASMISTGVSGMQTLTFSRCPIIDIYGLRLELSHALSIRHLRDTHYMFAWFARVSLLHANPSPGPQNDKQHNNNVYNNKKWTFSKQNMM